MRLWEHWESGRTYSQSGQAKTLRSARWITCKVVFHCSIVHRITHCDLKSKCVKRYRVQELSEADRIAHLIHCKTAVSEVRRCYSGFYVVLRWEVFTEEPSLDLQNAVYSLVEMSKKLIAPRHLLCMWLAFTRSIMFSIAVLKWVWLSRSLTLEWKSMASTITVCYSLSRCCQQSSILQAIHLSLNNTMFLLTMPRTPLHYYNKKCQILLVLISGHQTAQTQIKWIEVLCSIKCITLQSTWFEKVEELMCLQCFDAVGWAAGRASGL